MSPDRDALTVAMAIAPGVYARNRLFALYKDARMRWARTRAGVLRGVVRQLAGERGDVEGPFWSRNAHGLVVLRYRIPAVQFERTLEVTELEAACLRYLGGKAKVAGLEPQADDRALVEGALRRLTHGPTALVADIEL